MIFSTVAVFTCCLLPGTCCSLHTGLSLPIFEQLYMAAKEIKSRAVKNKMTTKTKTRWAHIKPKRMQLPPQKAVVEAAQRRSGAWKRKGMDCERADVMAYWRNMPFVHDAAVLSDRCDWQHDNEGLRLRVWALAGSTRSTRVVNETTFGVKRKRKTTKSKNNNKQKELWCIATRQELQSS